MPSSNSSSVNQTILHAADTHSDCVEESEHQGGAGSEEGERRG